MNSSAACRACRKCRAKSTSSCRICPEPAGPIAGCPPPAINLFSIQKPFDLCERLLYNLATPRYNKVFFPKTL
ncbi:hypothetical protein C3R43_18410 [Serratia marcescens]|nr:hypothetical protein C3R39_20890 [Serratia marcescens]POP24829.1 hypothetical protein C3R43_18410 [Serratia marcescens]HAU97461.1 hypothetical protein [Serratia marcescens]